MTTIRCTGDSLEITNEGRKAVLTVERALQLFNDVDVLESITRAWRNKGELVTVPSISNARGLKPRNSQRLGVIQ
jgi:hypothetical protein